ncbi:MAG: TetR/AcrR family transcriptional regulator [Spirochaetes bacterium]|nr:TetR/AcrR family transcriptional regulator [Spirochaetota bacterium]MBU1082103.1 TetR/AcrR family transcriptional regulator [Spirochaetota bacterium]
METAERKRLDRERRAEFILDKAQALAFQRGFEAATMDDIAEASGYTKRSVYLYFRDRDEVFLALALRGQRALLAALREAADAARGGESTVRAFGSAFYRFSLASPGYFELVMAYEAKRHSYARGRIDDGTPAAACQNISVEYGELLSEALARDMAAGRMRPDLDARQAMMLLWGQVFGVMQILLMRREGFEAVYGVSPEAFFESFLRQLERGLLVS